MTLVDGVFFTASICALAGWLSGRRLIAYGGLLVACVSLVWHLAVAGYRWQLVPAYVAFAVLLWVTIRSPLWKKTIAAGSATLVVVSVAATQIFPVFQIPDPGGSYAVGTVVREYADVQRPESATADPQDHRRLLVRYWYPAAANDLVREKYLAADPQRDATLAGGLSLPAAFGFLFSHLPVLEVNSSANAPAAEGVFPVVLFSHGMMFGFPGQNTLLVETLASHGYVVAAIDHAYWSLLTRYQDGTVASSQAAQDRFKRLWSEAASTRHLDEEIVRLDLAAPRIKELMEEVMRLQPEVAAAMREAIQTWTDDQKFVMDQLAEVASSDTIMAGRLDLTRLGVSGMSLGGSSALDTCTTDMRCKAVVNIDGFQPESVRLPALAVPSLHITHARGAWNRYNFEAATAPAWFCRVADTEHMNFSDFALMTPALAGTPLMGEIDGQHGLQILNQLVLAFFDDTIGHAEVPGIAEAADAFANVDLLVR